MRRRNFFLIVIGLVVCLVVLVQLHLSRSHLEATPHELLMTGHHHHSASTLPPAIEPTAAPPQNSVAKIAFSSPVEAPSSPLSKNSGERHFVLLGPSLGLDPNAPAEQRQQSVARKAAPNPALHHLHEKTHFLRRLYAEHHSYSYILDDGSGQLPSLEAAIGAGSGFATLSDFYSAATGRSASAWFKIWLLQKHIASLLALQKTVREPKDRKELWLVFLDVDVMVTDFERSLESILDALPRREADSIDIVVGSAPVGQHDDLSAPLSGERGANIVETGFMFVRVSDWSLRFFQEVFKMGDTYRESGAPAACGANKIPLGMSERGAMQCIVDQLRLGLGGNGLLKSSEQHSNRIFVVKPPTPSTSPSSLSALLSSRSSPFVTTFPQCRLPPDQHRQQRQRLQQPRCHALIESAFRSILSKNHIHENIKMLGTPFVKIPSVESLLGLDRKSQQQNQLLPLTTAVFTFVRRKDLRNSSLRDLFWSARNLRETFCEACGFDCITEFEPASILGTSDILDDDDDDVAAKNRFHESHKHDPAAHSSKAVHLRQKRQEAFWEGKWKLLHDILLHYESVIVAPADAFFVLDQKKETQQEQCARFSTPALFSVAGKRQSDGTLKSCSPSSSNVPACFDVIFTADWRGTISGGIFAVRNTRWIRSLLTQTLQSGRRRYQHGDAQHQQQQEHVDDINNNNNNNNNNTVSRAFAADIRPVVSLLTTSGRDCFYCADDADDALAREIAVASTPPQVVQALLAAQQSRHRAVAVHAGADAGRVHSLIPREHLIDEVNAANGGGGGAARKEQKNQLLGGRDASEKAVVYRVFIETDHRRWNAYAFPNDDRRAALRYRPGQDFVARFPRCGLFSSPDHPSLSCASEASRLYRAVFESLSASSALLSNSKDELKWAPTIADETIGASTELSSLMLPAASLSAKASSLWRSKPLHRPAASRAQGSNIAINIASINNDGEEQQENMKRDSRAKESKKQLRVPTSPFAKTSDVAVLVVVCASSRSSGIDNVHGEGDAVARGVETGDVALMHRLTFETKLAYAQRHGYDLIVEDCHSASHNQAVDPAWSKMLAPRRWLQHYHTVLQLDASAIIMNLAKDVFTLERGFAMSHRSSAGVKAQKTSNNDNNDHFLLTETVLMLSRDMSGEAASAVLLWRNRAVPPSFASAGVDQLFQMLQDAATQQDCAGRNKHYDQSVIRCALNHALGKLKTGGTGGHGGDDNNNIPEGAANNEDPVAVVHRRRRELEGNAEFEQMRAQGLRGALAERLIAVAPIGVKLLFGVPRQLLLPAANSVPDTHGRGVVNINNHRGANLGRVQQRAKDRNPAYWSVRHQVDKLNVYRYRAGDFAAFIPHSCSVTLLSMEPCVHIVQELLRESHSFNNPPFGTVDQGVVPTLLLPVV